MSRWASVVCGLAIVAIVAGSFGVSLGRQEEDGQEARRGEGAFEATALLRVRGRPADPAGDGGAYRAFRKTQAELLRSPIVLNAVLRRPGIADFPTLSGSEDPVEWIADRLEIVDRDGTEVMILRLRGDRADDVRRILAAVTEVYLGDIADRERLERTARRDSLEKKHKEMMAESKLKKQTYSGLVEKNGPSDAKAMALREEISRMARIADQIGLQLESPSLDPKAPPRVTLLEEVSVRKSE